MSGPLLTGHVPAPLLRALPVTSPSLLILGTDAVRAASPATPVQLAHACLAAGYRSVVPASWGDELLARRIIEAIENTIAPLVVCSCPFVTRRLSRNADDIGSMVLSCVAPPVAAAAYLRALYAPAGVRITFAGACPSAGHASIDAWLTPAELLADLEKKGIRLVDQPTEFDSILPPDRRRHYSEPGGVPSREALRRASDALELVELEATDFAIELAQALLAGGPRLVDAAPALGCVCSGAGTGVAPHEARARVRACEPPRALSPVVDHDVDVGLDLVVLPGVPERARAAAPASPVVALGAAAVVDSSPSRIAMPVSSGMVASTVASAPRERETERKRSPTGSNRAIIGPMPQSRASGRQLPRAYVARRRSSPKGIRQSAVHRQIDVMGPYRDRSAKPIWIWLAGAGTVIVAVALLFFALARN